MSISITLKIYCIISYNIVETVQGGVPPYGVKETLVVNGKQYCKYFFPAGATISYCWSGICKDLYKDFTKNIIITIIIRCTTQTEQQDTGVTLAIHLPALWWHNHAHPVRLSIVAHRIDVSNRVLEEFRVRVIDWGGDDTRWVWRRGVGLSAPTLVIYWGLAGGGSWKRREGMAWVISREASQLHQVFESKNISIVSNHVYSTCINKTNNNNNNNNNKKNEIK